MESSHTVNALNQKWRANEQQRQGFLNTKQTERRSPAKGTGHDNKDNKQRCYNCNRVGHFARDSGCPAKTKSCNKCGVKGHFSACCRKGKPGNKDKKREKTYKVSEDEDKSPENGYAFVIGQHGQNDMGEVTLTIGGVKLGNILIDLGSTCNVIDYRIWDYLKQNRVRCDSKTSDKKLFVYGQKDPIDVVGTFTAEIVCEVNGAKCMDEFTVIKENGKSILGKKTAEQLRVLRVGPEETAKGTVNTVTEEGSESDIREEFADIFTRVGLLKDYKLKLHIDEDVIPVAQPVRRLPFGLRDKVDDKLDEY